MTNKDDFGFHQGSLVQLRRIRRESFEDVYIPLRVILIYCISCNHLSLFNHFKELTGEEKIF